MENIKVEVEVIREPDNGTETLGILHVVNEAGATILKCDTLELPFKNNEHNVSCINKGKYICKKVAPSQNIPYDHISITNVTNRDGVCIHKANYVSQLRGCIAVGEGLQDINKDGQLDVINSGTTFDKLMAILPQEFNLTIK